MYQTYFVLKNNLTFLLTANIIYKLVVQTVLSPACDRSYHIR